jgi:endonuclease VIII
MSEGPEVHRQAGMLHEEITGSRIVAIESRLKKARAWIEAHPGLIDGKEIRRVYAAGKNLIWELEDDLYFHIHLLMFGKLRTYTLRHRVEWERTTRALIVTTAKQVVLTNVQVFNIGQGNPFTQIVSLREIGPDICAVPFDRRLFLERLNAPSNADAEIGPVLLLQSVAAGLGNYLKSDILFECGINPWTKVADLSPEQQERLAEVIPQVSQRSLRNKGQTVTDEIMERLVAENSALRWRDKHWVFRQSSKPCKVCGTPIRQGRQGPDKGRVTFFCPQCQSVDV